MIADVARYQNDGTEKITPSKFIERAKSAAGDWQDEVERAITEYIEGGGDPALLTAVKQIATDISRVCDRVKTGKLKASFEGKVD